MDVLRPERMQSFTNRAQGLPKSFGVPHKFGIDGVEVVAIAVNTPDDVRKHAPDADIIIHVGHAGADDQFKYSGDKSLDLKTLSTKAKVAIVTSCWS